MNNSEEKQSTVYIVDDDDAMRESLTWLIESVGLNVETYASADEFLESYYPGRPGCVLLDVRMPGMSGLELQGHLQKQQVTVPVIMITGHGDVPMAVRAMKSGAIDFIEKPFNDEQLLESIRNALAIDDTRRDQQSFKAEVASRLAQLTPRESEVMDMVTAGKSNKEIANSLGVSAKTVEAHRAKVMEKMEAGSLAELVRLVVSSHN
ncbi:MAG: response regulator transcription factor [Gammaproteobacteria bacterium]|nr:response regulator transcription factor [Gammaproteobacteria bacterium]NNJ92750.1 response regulator transcription factor [Gammaproteobacteria bacterium]